MIAIIDYGLGNLGSIKNMLKKIGEDSLITSDPAEIAKATKIILPGVGKFDAGMNGISELGLRDVLDHKVISEGVPVLGICLGMQMLTEGSEEGKLPGLGWIKGYTYKFKLDETYKIPHMGWNTTQVVNKNKLTEKFEDPMKFYFVHSYYVKTETERDTFLLTNYGVDFASGIHHNNIYGVQFHPEKSHKYGMQLLRSFADM
jgi:glutamine amidotransferase